MCLVLADLSSIIQCLQVRLGAYMCEVPDDYIKCLLLICLSRMIKCLRVTLEACTSVIIPNE